MNTLSTHMTARVASALLALAVAGSALAVATPAPTLRAALDYSARFSPIDNEWQVFRSDGRSLRVPAGRDCDNAQAPPEGLWLLTRNGRSEEYTSELQPLMRISY